MTVIPNVIGALGTVTKGLIQGLEDLEIRRQVETIQNKRNYRPEYWEESWTLEEICYQSNPRGKPSANTAVKTFKMSKIIITILKSPVSLSFSTQPTISLQRGDSSNGCLGYDTKQSDNKAPVMLELWGLRRILSLLSFPAPPWPVAVTHDRVLFIGQIEPFDI